MPSDVGSLEYIINNVLFDKQWLSLFITHFIFALIILFIGLKISRYASKYLHLTLANKKLDSTVCEFITSIIYYLLITITMLLSLSQLGVKTATLIALLSAGSLAIGLALKGTLSHFAAGLLLLILRPFKVGDYIEGAGIAGTFESIQLFHCTLKTVDNKYIVVPNNKILNGNIINFSHYPERRIDLVIGVSYQADLKQVKQILETVVVGNEYVLKYPQATIAVSELASSSVNFVVRPWVNTVDSWRARCALIEAIKIEFDKAEVKIPYRQLSVHCR
ncbi:mechanosensitive ion channel family protein [Psychromonas aquatilis]|uniref:Small-conductance mechanosensitive channel n=1 Tax=Psychromonas aquatilis TaxID=2005072 RepID=A0ABU9GRT4_9GAMM